MLAVEPLRELARAAAAQVVDHAGPVRRGHDDVLDPWELQPVDSVDRGLTVVGADDHGVPLEELVEPPAAAISASTEASERASASCAWSGPNACEA